MRERCTSIERLGRALAVQVGVAVALAACGSAFSAAEGQDGGTDAKADTAVIGSGDGGQDGSVPDGPSGDTGVSADAAPEARLDGAPEAATDAADGSFADAGCPVTGESCVPAAPSGWTGPVEFASATSAAPGCPSGMSEAFTAHAGLTAAPATCSECTCGTQAGESCSVVFDVFDNQTCGTPACASGVLTPNCIGLGQGTCNPDGGTYMTVTAHPAGGQCPASPQAPTVPPPTWSTNAAACASVASPTPCGAQGVCVPATGSTFSYCVYQSGDVSCPTAGPYTDRQVVYEGVSDTRSCTSCACGAPGGQCLGGTYSFATTCGGSLDTLPTPCSSFELGRGFPSNIVTPPTLQAGTCTPSGGSPTGSATATSPVTVCCSP